MKKFFYTKARWLLTTIIAITLLMLALPNRAWASYEDWPKENQSFEWDFVNGWLYIKINISDNESGATHPDGGVDFSYGSNNNNSSIRLYSGGGITFANLYWGCTNNGHENYRIQLMQSELELQYKSGGVWYPATAGLTINGTTTSSYTSGNHTVHQLELRVTIPASYYGDNIIVAVRGQWGRNGGQPNSDIVYNYYGAQNEKYKHCFYIYPIFNMLQQNHAKRKVHQSLVLL